MTTPVSLDAYRLLGRSGLRVSPLSLGTMTFGSDWGWGADADEGRRIFDTYVDRGGNFIDTSVNYTDGTAERLVGEFARHRRENLVIARTDSESGKLISSAGVTGRSWHCSWRCGGQIRSGAWCSSASTTTRPGGYRAATLTGCYAVPKRRNSSGRLMTRYHRMGLSISRLSMPRR